MTTWKGADVATKEAVARMFLVLRANWPDRQVDKDMMRVYEEALGDLPDGVLEAAAMVCVSTCTFYPKIGELRKAAQDAAYQAMGYVSGDMAYIEVQRYYDSGGKIQPSSDLALQALDHIGGIWSIRTSDRPDWTRKAFIDTYNALVGYSKTHEYALPCEKELRRQMSLERARNELENLLELPSDNAEYEEA